MEQYLSSKFSVKECCPKIFPRQKKANYSIPYIQTAITMEPISALQTINLVQNIFMVVCNHVVEVPPVVAICVIQTVSINLNQNFII